MDSIDHRELLRDFFLQRVTFYWFLFAASFEKFRHAFVGKEHEFLDQCVTFGANFFDDFFCFAVFVDDGLVAKYQSEREKIKEIYKG